MANVKISELNELTQVDDDDLLVVVDTSANETKKIRAENVGTGGGGDSTPIGTIEAFSGSTAPNGYLLCDGSAVSRTTYADLFAVIGTTYGTGDGSTTFNLPNLKGRTVVMRDTTQTEFDTLGETGGEKTHVLTTTEMPSHSHPIGYAMTGGSGTTVAIMSYAPSSTFGTDSVGGGQAHNILQPYIVLNYVIKAFKVSSTPTSSQVVNAYSESTNNVYSCDYVNNAIRKSKNETLNNETNIDNITSSGVYGIFNATGTLPGGYTNDNNIFIQSMLWGDGTWGRQVLYDIRSNNTYTRQKLNGTWQSWVSLV